MPAWKKVTKIIRPTDVKKPRKWSGAKEGLWIVRTPIGKWLHRVEGQLCRMPSYFPNYNLSMLPLTQQQIDEYQRTGHISSALTFKTSVKMNKVEIKKYLETLYGLDVNKVHTAVITGKKYQQLTAPFRYFRKSDWKKVWVYLNAPAKEADVVSATRGLAASGVPSAASSPSPSSQDRVASGASPTTSPKSNPLGLPDSDLAGSAGALSSGGLLGWFRNLKLSVTQGEGGKVDETLRTAKGEDQEARRRAEAARARRY